MWKYGRLWKGTQFHLNIFFSKDKKIKMEKEEKHIYLMSPIFHHGSKVITLDVSM